MNASDISVTSDTSQLGIVPYPDSDPYTVHKPVSAASSKHAEIASVKVASVRATAGGGEGTGGGDGGEGGGEGGEGGDGGGGGGGVHES